VISFAQDSGIKFEKFKIIQLSDAVTDVFWSPLTDAVRPNGAGSTAFMEVDWINAIGSFAGELKLNKTGKGFASYRALSQWNLEGTEKIQFYVKGDGRTYRLLLKDSASMNADDDFSYQATFETVKNEWVLVSLETSSFKPFYRGQVIAAPLINLSDIQEIGLQINDGKAGPFNLEFTEIFGLRQF
jgi:hypothetical protein